MQPLAPAYAEAAPHHLPSAQTGEGALAAKTAAEVRIAARSRAEVRVPKQPTPQRKKWPLPTPQRQFWPRPGGQYARGRGSGRCTGAADACTIACAAGYVLKRLVAGAQKRWRRRAPPLVVGAPRAPSAFPRNARRLTGSRESPVDAAPVAAALAGILRLRASGAPLRMTSGGRAQR